jgi:leader peptidase (prepilin peptidase) / N-methyltransferase
VLTPLALVLALLGAAWGSVADRIAARWPEHVHEHVHDHADGDPEHEHAHEPGDEPVEGRAWAHEHPHEHRPSLEHGRVTPRRPDWRTAVVVLVGALALGGVTLRFTDPVPAVVFGAYLATLVLLLATDLDQRILPGLVTRGLIPLAFLFSLAGLNPLVPRGVLPIALAVAIGLPVLLYAFSLPFARGAFGRGDVWLLVSVGLMVGPLRLFNAVVVGALLAGVVLVVLLAARRITLKSFVPYGPFLIVGAMWVTLVVQ